ncbi:hypothetical protein NPN23_25225, partial [Vibrio parahaemolyticus]|nr:hypothetical protein [Vibrio parahaemolyticus]
VGGFFGWGFGWCGGCSSCEGFWFLMVVGYCDCGFSVILFGVCGVVCEWWSVVVCFSLLGFVVEVCGVDGVCLCGCG